MSLLRGFARHLREGTLLRRLAGGSAVPPVHWRVRWQGADSVDEAAAALAHWGGRFAAAKTGGWLMTLGEGGELQAQLQTRLERAGLRHRAHALGELRDWHAADAATLAGILCAYTDAARLTAAAQVLARHPVLAAVPFEYAPGLHPERALFTRRDEYAATHFIAPALRDDPGPYRIYEESLQRFEQKCGLRDYLDLYQVLRHVVDNRVPGDIAEFGSYRGHSGWLIARTLQALGSDKRLYMFDTFAAFPDEGGVDHFWTRSHAVDFEEVRGKLAAFADVTLVRGDFTQTLATSGLGAVALAYVDCDSYRATRFLIEALWDRHLAVRGALVCEDYGHPALLGNRAAVHESLDGRAGAFRYFSQFSGFYIALKLPTP